MPKKGNKHLCIFSDFRALRTWGLLKNILLLSTAPQVSLTLQYCRQHGSISWCLFTLLQLLTLNVHKMSWLDVLSSTYTFICIPQFRIL